MNIKKILVLSFCSLSMFAYAAAKEDESSYQPTACMIMVEDARMVRQINVNYIRLVYVNKDKPSVLNMSMASNYYNGDTDKFSVTYPSAQEAMKSLEATSNSINYCRENARAKMKK